MFSRDLENEQNLVVHLCVYPAFSYYTVATDQFINAAGTLCLLLAASASGHDAVVRIHLPTSVARVTNCTTTANTHTR